MSESYADLRQARLRSFLQELAYGGIGEGELAEAVADTAPPGWPVDLGEEPTLDDIATALESGTTDG